MPLSRTAAVILAPRYFPREPGEVRASDMVVMTDFRPAHLAK
jgi:hypothetical protein